MSSSAHFRFGEIPQALFDEMREHLWLFTASFFRLESLPVYCGTCTLVTAGGAPRLLTAAHVWKELRGDRFALSLDADRLLIPIDKRVVQAVLLSGGTRDEWGPDLALIRVPDVVASNLWAQTKCFYNLDTRREKALTETPQYNRGLWAVIGAVGEQSTFTPAEALLGMRVYASASAAPSERDGFDYVDLPYDRENRPNLPRSFGGMSGSGLWQCLLQKTETTGAISIKEVRLEGVAFYQMATSESSHQGFIRCHGRNSLYAHALARVVEDS